MIESYKDIYNDYFPDETIIENKELWPNHLKQTADAYRYLSGKRIDKPNYRRIQVRRASKSKDTAHLIADMECQGSSRCIMTVYDYGMKGRLLEEVHPLNIYELGWSTEWNLLAAMFLHELL